MSQEQPVSWDAVKMLAMTVGVREAARRLGLSEDRVRQRSCREGWFKSPEAKQALEMARENRAFTTARTVTALSPSQAMAMELAGLGQKSRLSFARGIARAAEHVETMDGQDLLAEAQNIKSVAQTANIVHNWADQSPRVNLRLELVGDKAEKPVVEVESEVVTEEEWD